MAAASSSIGGGSCVPLPLLALDLAGFFFGLDSSSGSESRAGLGSAFLGLNPNEGPLELRSRLGFSSVVLRICGSSGRRDDISSKIQA